MGFIIYIRNKKWLLRSFSLCAIALLVAILISPIYSFLGFRSSNIAVVSGYPIAKNAYQNEIKKHSEEGKGSIHERVYESLTRKTLMKGIASEMGIVVSPEILKIDLNRFGTATQEALKRYDKGRYNNWKNKENPKEAFHAFLKSLDSRQKKQYMSQLAIQVKDIIIETRILNLFTKGPAPFLDPKNLKNTVVSVNLVKIPAEDVVVSESTPKEIAMAWAAKSLRSDEEFRRASYIRFAGPSSREEIQEQIETLQELRASFKKEKKTNIEGFIGKNTDEKDKKNFVKKWALEEALEAVAALSQGDVSDPIYREGSVFLYRRKADENREIVAYVIKKEIDKKELSPIAERTAKGLQKELKKTSWQGLIKEKGFHLDESEKIKVTRTMANKIGSPNLFDHIAYEIYHNDYRNGDSFVLKHGEEYVLVFVEKKGREDFEPCIQKELEEEAKNKKRIEQVKKKLKGVTLPKEIKLKLDREYSDYREQKLKEISSESSKLTSIECPEEIIKLLLGEKKVVFYDKSNNIIVVAYVTSRRDRAPQKPASEEIKPDVVSFMHYILNNRRITFDNRCLNIKLPN